MPPSSRLLEMRDQQFQTQWRRFAFPYGHFFFSRIWGRFRRPRLTYSLKWCLKN